MSKPFLEYVAADILRKHGHHLARVAVVFPNKRASLFLNDHLARQAGRPIWSPAYITISDLFRNHADVTVADPIRLVCELHRCFVEVTGIDETLDHFYGWGQLLLADFDDLDKNMADASRVFANLRDLHELDGVSYLNDDQKAVIKRFFSNFTDNYDTELKQRFMRLWSKMGDIYSRFNEQLASEQLAYEGQLYRQVAEMPEIEFRYDKYIFVGFNLLQKVEKVLFERLKQQGKAFFYWDFDHYYMTSARQQGIDNEAGHFIGQYLESFPNELDTGNPDIYRQFVAPKDISFVSASTENIQARYVTQWLRRQDRIADGRRTAVVLCNEALLQAVIHALPDEVDKVNVTTGYPLANTPVASLVGKLIALQTSGYAVSRDRFRLHYVRAVLEHPYAPWLSPQAASLCQSLKEQKVYYPSREQLSGDDSSLHLLFSTRVNNNGELMGWISDVLQVLARQADTDEPLFQESVFRAYTLVNRLQSLIDDGTLRVDVVTLQRLMAQLIQSTSIPFHGEPAEGIQVMGVLETRNLDFDHVLMLSCNEGNMPRGVSDTSFIPYNLRKAHGMTTVDHKVAIYSYYFHRLLARAKDVTIVYNNATTDGQRGEMSRFMLQLLVESPHPIHPYTLHAQAAVRPVRRPVVEKSGQVMDRLTARFRLNGQPTQPLLTPTAVNRYLRCPLQFYYNYVCGIFEPDANDDDTIDNRIFGNIFHEASRLVYTRLTSTCGPTLKKSDIESMLKSEADLQRAVDEAFRTELFQLKTGGLRQPLELNGLQTINREVILHYLRQLLTIDSRLAPFTIVGLECLVASPMEVCSGPLSFPTCIGGRIDRLDRITTGQGECLRVIDYKTGSRKMTPLANTEAIFLQESLARHSDYYLQAFLYSLLVRESAAYNPRQLPVSPALLFIQHAGADDYDPVLKLGSSRVADIATERDAYLALLNEKIGEIFDSTVPFAPTAAPSRCERCPFAGLCVK